VILLRTCLRRARSRVAASSLAMVVGCLCIAGCALYNAIPVATFSWSLSGESIAVDASLSRDPDGSIVSYRWDFGDGQNGTGVTLTHVYNVTEPQTLVVRLTITDDSGACDTADTEVTLTPAVRDPDPSPPDSMSIARLSATPTSGDAPLTVSFAASGPTDADGRTTQYLWTLGDGHSATGKSVSHTYNVSGRYTVILAVTDSEGHTATATARIVVGMPTESVPGATNCSPEARFVVTPLAGEAPLSVVLDATASADTDGTISYFQWAFGDGSTAAGPIVTHMYSIPGSYTVTLEVTDNSGSISRASRTIQCTEPTSPAVEAPNASPEAHFTAAPASGRAPLTVQFDASTSADEDGEIVFWYWEFGDGGTGRGARPLHTYEHSGAFQVTLNVSDDYGSDALSVMTIMVSEAGTPPVIFEYYVAPNPTCLLEAPASGYVRFSCGDGDGLVTHWVLEVDGELVLEDFPRTRYAEVALQAFHEFALPGPVDVTLTVWDDDGLSASDSLTACPITKRVVTAHSESEIGFPRGVAFVGETLCVSTNSHLWFVNPVDHGVVRSLPLPGIRGGYLAYDGSSLWVSSLYQDTAYEIDPDTGQLLGACAVPGDEGLAYDGAQLWTILNTSRYERMVSGICQGTGEVLQWFQFSRSSSMGDLAHDGTALWIAWHGPNCDPYFTRVDQMTGTEIESFHIPSTFLGLGSWGLCAHDGLLWIPKGEKGHIEVFGLNPHLWIGWDWDG